MPKLPENSSRSAITTAHGEKAPSTSATKTLTLQRDRELKHISQRLGHGRLKAVVLETIKSRSMAGDRGIEKNKNAVTKKTRRAKKRKKSIRASLSKLGPPSRTVSVGGLYLGDNEDVSSRKIRKKRRAGGSSGKYSRPSAGVPGNEHNDPNPTGRRSGTTAPDRYRAMFGAK